MLPDPLHPVVVHFPLVLSVFVPLFALGALIAIRRGVAARPPWALVVALAGLLFASSFAAVRTGEAQEERVEDIVGEQILHEHEEAGERMIALSGVALVLLGAGLLGGRLGGYGRVAGTVASLVVLAGALQVGHSGGELVYRHGAAAAYASGASRPGNAAEPQAPGADENEDREEGGGSEEP